MDDMDLNDIERQAGDRREYIERYAEWVGGPHYDLEAVDKWTKEATSNGTPMPSGTLVATAATLEQAIVTARELRKLILEIEQAGRCILCKGFLGHAPDCKVLVAIKNSQWLYSHGYSVK